MQLRTITANDHSKLIPFWQENYFITGLDSLEKFKLFLEKNPGLSVLIEENGEIIGTALGSFDGRRGYLQKVVTAKNLRAKGIGKQMVQEVLKRLKAAGAVYVPLSAKKEIVAFYEKCGFEKLDSTSMKFNF
jgi:ribosomal protein S18 acetylase RimI-like enzyme